jgi:outer membrane immunogenic protein
MDEMKRVLGAAAAVLSTITVASAADFPATPARVGLSAPIIFSWTGCYVGAEGGGAWGSSEHVVQSGTIAGTTITGKFDLSGAIAGGTVGCNLQLSNFVIGIENDYSWTNKQGSAFNIPPFDPTTTSTTREKWIDTLRGRFGYVPWDRVMVYGTGGIAWAGTSVDVSNPAFGLFSDSKVRTGWVVGVGGEWAAWSAPGFDLTFKLEWLHADFDRSQYFSTPIVVGGATVVTRDVRLTDELVRLGMNVKFN